MKLIISKKDYELYDHAQEAHAKPFLIGVNLVKNEENLIKQPLDELINYKYHLNWKVNNKRLSSMKSFAHFFNKIVNRKKIKTFVF